MVSDMIRRLGVLVVGALAFTVVPAAPAPAASEPPAVGMHTESFVDHSRATPADVVAGITPENERRLPTTIFYPARGKPAADGPRYKALGNAMACNVMRWIGMRIALFEQIRRAA